MRGCVGAASLLSGVALAGGLAACGTESSAPVTTGAAQDTPPQDCQPVGETAEGSLELCAPTARDEHGRFVLDTGTARRDLDIPAPGPTPSASDAGKVGHWAWAALALDGRRVLAQWSAECEVPIAFFVDLDGNVPDPITGEEDWAESPESVALGWTTDGRAIAFLPHGPACGTGVERPGIYLYKEPGRGKLLVKTNKAIRASIKPRDVAAIRAYGR